MQDKVFVISELKVVQGRLRLLNRSNKFAKDVARELVAIHDQLEEVLHRVEIATPKAGSE